MQKKIYRALFSIWVLCMAAQTLQAEPSAQSDGASAADTSSKAAKISLAEVAPELYYQLRRYPKFYGDDNTIHGTLLERSYLLGSVGGTRDFLVEHGFYFDAGVTQFLQGNVSGGEDSGDARYNGTADYWLTFDSGKAGLWSGGAVFLHAESSWQADRSVNSDTGSLLPANYDAAMPTPNDSEGLVLPEVFFAQALPANLLVLAGKINWAGVADTNVFANNERTQFSSTGLVNNPILGSFAPYTSLGMALAWAPEHHTLTAFAFQKDGDATTSGFDNFNGDYTVGIQYQFSPDIAGGLPGNYLILVGYTNQDLPDFDIDPRHLIGEIVGEVPVAEKSDNYSVLLNFDQYLWIEDGGPAAGRKHLPPLGVGIFGRAGWAPKDRNVIDQFYSFGIGGYGMLIPGRDNDQWGVGWTGTHISSDLRDDLDLLGIDLNSFEHAVEAFYNFQLTPATHLTVDAQLIDSTAKSVDTAFLLGTRLQIDF
jgi:carbohydrate-selective porin OprB